MDPVPQPAPKVFEEIALSLSGGGYRAAAFHLGTLSLLSHLGLLPSVKVLSTVSGGTIIGATWACSLIDGKSHEDFETEFKTFLRTTNVIQSSLDALEEAERINGKRMMPSLIRSAARVYSRAALFADRKFKSLEVVAPNDPKGRHPTQLTEISFNATDFRTGGSFRFQQSNSSGVYSGNKRFNIKRSVVEVIRLADIVAASSCFPSGFEPLRFPSDFEWGGAPQLESVRKDLGEKFENEVGLMDGGVFDNQGIDSIGLIYARKDREIGMYIISDTSQRNAVHLETPVVPKSGRFSVANVALLLWTLYILGFTTTIALLVDAYVNVVTTGISIMQGVFLYAIPIIFCCGVAFALYKLRSAVKQFLIEFNAETAIDVWANFKDVSVSGAVEMIRTRVKSVVAMTSSVFMKRIRDLGYKRIYGDSDFEKKRISNMIYDLDNSDQWRPYVEENGVTPSLRLRKLAKDAESYPTNLWFTDKDKLETLTACGAATMCFNILRYLLEHRPAKLKDPKSPESILYSRAKDYWNTIQ